MREGARRHTHEEEETRLREYSSVKVHARRRRECTPVAIRVRLSVSPRVCAPIRPRTHARTHSHAMRPSAPVKRGSKESHS